MGVIILATVIFAAVIALVAVFSRSATHETWRVSAGFPFKLGAAQLHELSRAIAQSRGLRIDLEQPHDDGGSGLVATDPTPVVGGRIHVRSLTSAAPIGSAEVQSSIDEARGEGYQKVLLIAPSGFSDEARSAADKSLVELIDGPRLAELSRSAVDMGALHEGRVVPRAETTLREQMLAAGTPSDLHP